MYTVHSTHCTLYTVECAVFMYAETGCALCTVQCRVCSVYLCRGWLYTVHCTMYILQCTPSTVHCTLYTIRYTLYNVHCTLHYTVHHRVCSTRWCRGPLCWCEKEQRVNILLPQNGPKHWAFVGKHEKLGFRKYSSKPGDTVQKYM